MEWAYYETDSGTMALIRVEAVKRLWAYHDENGQYRYILVLDDTTVEITDSSWWDLLNELK